MALTPEFPRYKSHKEVRALQIDHVEKHRIFFVDDRFPPLEATRDFINKHKPESGGYLVIYADGYMSFSPQTAFVEGYTLIGEEE